MTTEIPRIVVIGKTGDGKTAFLNNLTQNKLFKEHNDLNIVVHQADWFGDKSKGSTLFVDSPGAFIDKQVNISSNEITKLFHINFLKQVCKGVNVLFLVLNIENVDFDATFASLYDMLQVLFSPRIKYHTAFVFTHCDPETKEKWMPKKEELLKKWNEMNPLNSNEPKVDFPLIFTSMKTMEGLENIPEMVKRSEENTSEL